MLQVCSWVENQARGRDLKMPVGVGVASCRERREPERHSWAEKKGLKTSKRGGARLLTLHAVLVFGFDVKPTLHVTQVKFIGAANACPRAKCSRGLA